METHYQKNHTAANQPTTQPAEDQAHPLDPADDFNPDDRFILFEPLATGTCMCCGKTQVSVIGGLTSAPDLETLEAKRKFVTGICLECDRRANEFVKSQGADFEYGGDSL